jgi:hypothetical protein
MVYQKAITELEMLSLKCEDKGANMKFLKLL